MKEDHVSLSNLGDGAAIELFNLELSRVLDNISDPNTKPTATRKITLTVTIKPQDDRGYGDVLVSCTSSLAPVSPFPTRFFIGNHRGKAVATEYNPKQAGLFDAPSNVTVIPRQEKQS